MSADDTNLIEELIEAKRRLEQARIDCRIQREDSKFIRSMIATSSRPSRLYKHVCRIR